MINASTFEQVVGNWRRKNRLFIVQNDICFQSYINENVFCEKSLDSLELLIGQLLDLALANCQNEKAMLRIIFDQNYDSLLITIKFTGNLEALPTQIALNKEIKAKIWIEHETVLDKVLLQIC